MILDILTVLFFALGLLLLLIGISRVGVTCFTDAS
jgi:hypothetical protein